MKIDVRLDFSLCWAVYSTANKYERFVLQAHAHTEKIKKERKAFISRESFLSLSERLKVLFR